MEDPGQNHSFQKPQAVTTTPRRSKRDWLEAGLKIMGISGAGGVRIDAICRELNVTKGSFYWHFKNRNDLMNALFEYWNQRETGELIDSVEKTIDSPRERLWFVARQVTLGDYNVAAEVAIRQWAIHDGSVKQRLEKVDAQRLAFFARNFSHCGFEADAAQLRALTLYSITLVREFMHTGESDGDLEKRLRASIDLLLKRG